MTRLTRSLHALKTQLGSRHGEGTEWSAHVLLAHLARTGAQRPSAVAEAMHADPSTISRQVADLLRLGLAERQTDPADRRAWLVRPTAAGHAAYADMRRRRETLFGSLVADWSPDEVDHLAALLGRLNDSFTAQRPQLLAALDADAAGTSSPSKGSA